MILNENDLIEHWTREMKSVVALAQENEQAGDFEAATACRGMALAYQNCAFLLSTVVRNRQVGRSDQMRKRCLAGEGDFNEADLRAYWGHKEAELFAEAEVHEQGGNTEAGHLCRGQAVVYGDCASQLIWGAHDYSFRDPDVPEAQRRSEEASGRADNAVAAIRAAEAAIPEQREREEREHLARLSGYQNIAQLTPREFEEFVGRWFERQGYVVQVTQQSSDHGVDARVSKDGRTAVVQVKHSPGGAVGRPVLQNICGQMVAERADSAYVVTSGRFTAEAQAWARDKLLALVDGEELARSSAGLVDAASDGR